MGHRKALGPGGSAGTHWGHMTGSDQGGWTLLTGDFEGRRSSVERLGKSRKEEG